MGWRFVKGHGTENDFVLLPDADGDLALTATQVAALCDRRAGIGADGVLRVVRSAADPEAAAMAGQAEWFMDYRNADGSVAQMCGNGARVFGRYLVDAGLAPAGALAIATRGGVRALQVPPAGDVSVAMGRAGLPSLAALPLVSVGDPAHGGRTWTATSVAMPNPHAVVFVDDLAEAGPLLDAPHLDPAAAFPEGANVEFAVVAEPGRLAMRVHERGVGETRSCGTGACAAVVAARRRGGRPDAQPRAWRVEVPGGVVEVEERADGEVVLTGPAVLVADGVLDDAWLAGHP